MYDLLANLGQGFLVAVSPTNLWLCLVGALAGTLIGVLPGLGPVATIAMLLPVTFGLDPAGGLIMLAGIYYGAQYGGSTTAILLNVPGEAASVVSALDGHQMARQGRAGVALAIAAIGSFIAGTFATLLVAALGMPLAQFTQLFAPADYFSLMILGLICAVVLSGGSLPKAFVMIALGLVLSTVGSDSETLEQRLTFRLPELFDGIEFVALAMGLFGLAEILRNLEGTTARQIVNQKINRLMPNRAEMAEAGPAIGRGTLLGSLLGVLPGGGAVLSSFASYTLEKRLSKTPQAFGKGAIAGLAGPESANNAASQTSFIPLLTMGIPSNAVMALMVGALTIHGIVPGPQFINTHSDLFWGVIVSMWIGNILLLIINLPLIGVWVQLLRVPYKFMFPAIVLLCCIGIYTVANSPFDVMMTAIFTLLGYVLMKFGYEAAPLLLAFVLGPLLEQYLRRTLQISAGDPSVFFTRPISASILCLCLLLVVIAVLPMIGRRRAEVFVED